MMLPVPMDDGAPPGPPEASAQVAFRGTIEGHLVITAHEGVLAELSANMLGEDGPVPPERQLDALGEAANVACGNLLPRIVGRQAVMRISAPQVARPAEGLPKPGEPVAETHLGLEAGAVSLALFVADLTPLQEAEP